LHLVFGTVSFGGKGGDTMRSYPLFVVGLLALSLHQHSVLAQTAPAPTNSSVKLRLEIEIRGVLSVTEKSVTLTNKETIYEYTNTGLQSRQVDKVWVLELDENLKKTAKTLHGKEVEATGKCLLLGVKSEAKTGKTPATIGSKKLRNPRGGPPFEVPVVVPEGLATSVQSQLLLDDRVTVLSLKAVK
jgi:hypothetical protein